MSVAGLENYALRAPSMRRCSPQRCVPKS